MAIPSRKVLNDQPNTNGVRCVYDGETPDNGRRVEKKNSKKPKKDKDAGSSGLKKTGANTEAV